MIQTSMRPDRRRQDREERRKAWNHQSAAAAAHRHKLDRQGKPRRPKKAGMRSPVPEGFFDLTKAERRAWAADREIERQRAAMRALVARGVLEATAKQQFGSF